MPDRKLPDLKRRQSTREPRRRFIIFCEGRNTEPTYFAAIKRVFADLLVEIETIGGSGVPQTIAHRASERAQSLKPRRTTRNVLSSFEEKDEVWAVIDRDQHPNYDDAVRICEMSGVGVARSNPCFELWLILHCEMFDRACHRKSVQAHLRKLRPEYNPSARKLLACGDLLAHVQTAETRAERQLASREAEGAAYGPPSTTVGDLTRAIRQAAELAQPLKPVR